MPMLILFIVIATIYYSSIHFEFSKAIKLGIIAGTLISIGFSLFIALVILIIRAIRLYLHSMDFKQTTSSFESNDKSVKLDPTLYEKKTRTIQKEITSNNSDISYIVKEKVMLLMNKDLTYEVATVFIKKQKLGNIIEYNKNDGLIILQNDNEEIRITISTLTKHTSEITISSTLNNINIKHIITSLKKKEHSFMQY